MLVKYLRNSDRTPFACIVGVLGDFDGVRVGWSECHPRDHFNKMRAREIAYNRAINGWNSKPACEELINNEMQVMKSRAEHYYNNEKPVKKNGLLASALRLFM
jgi:hypothetical protein